MARSMARPTAGGSQDQGDFGAFAADSKDAVAVLFAEVGDVGAGGFEDPHAKQTEHRDRGEVARVCRLAAGGEHGSSCRWVNPRWVTSAARPAPDVLGGRVVPATTENRRETVEGLK